jgi:hypothetical protein
MASELLREMDVGGEHDYDYDGRSLPLLPLRRRVQADGSGWRRAVCLRQMRTFGDPQRRDLQVRLPEVL